MKRFMLLSALVIAMPLSMLAQDDDLYFTPKKKTQKTEVKEDVTPVTYSGSSRSIDEYNRRGQYRSKVQPIEGSDSLDFTMGMLPDSVYADSLFVDRYSKYNFEAEDDNDYTYSRMLDRWYGMYDPWFYGPGYYGRYWSPFYRGYWGYYDPWYYGYGYYGYYDPWYYGYYGLGYGGWYDPWYYGYNHWGYPYYGGYGYGWGWNHGGFWGGSIGGGSSYAHIGRGNSAQAGGATLASGGAGRRGNSFNNIARRQDGGAANIASTGTTRSNGARTNYGAGTRRTTTGTGTRSSGSAGSRSSYSSGSRSNSSYTPSSSSNYSTPATSYGSGSRSSSSSSSSYGSGSRSSSSSSSSYSSGSRSSSGSSGGGFSGGGGGHSGRR